MKDLSKCTTTLFSWISQHFLRIEGASISEMQSAEVILTRKPVLQDKNVREATSNGSKGGLASAERILKTPGRAVMDWGRLTKATPQRNSLMGGKQIWMTSEASNLLPRRSSCSTSRWWDALECNWVEKEAFHHQISPPRKRMKIGWRCPWAGRPSVRTPFHPTFLAQALHRIRQRKTQIIITIALLWPWGP